VRNADDWPVKPQIGHSAVKWLDVNIQTQFNVLQDSGNEKKHCER